MNALDPSFLKRVQERATDRCLFIVENLTDRMIVNGTTYGDIPLDSPEEFVTFYLDLDKRGILPHLEVVSPTLAEQYRRRFARDSAKVMGLE